MLLTVGFVLIAIFAFFRNLAGPFMLGALAVPVIVTFGFAELAVDYLNTSTAFLGSIVIGNGLNPDSSGFPDTSKSVAADAGVRRAPPHPPRRLASHADCILRCSRSHTGHSC